MRVEEKSEVMFQPISLIIDSEVELMLLIRLYGGCSFRVKDNYHNTSAIYAELASVAKKRGIDIHDYEKYKQLVVKLET